MSSSWKINSVTQATPFQQYYAHEVSPNSETRFYAEDGWVFSMRPGKPIECLYRYDDRSIPTLIQLGFFQQNGRGN